MRTDTRSCCHIYGDVYLVFTHIAESLLLDFFGLRGFHHGRCERGGGESGGSGERVLLARGFHHCRCV